MKYDQDYIRTRSKRVASGCWEWQRYVNAKGYGTVSCTGARTRRAHRVAYEAFAGPIPKGLCVLHTCDNRKCVNPDHLWLGTVSDNAADREEKGRGGNRAGENNANSKLTRVLVIAMREAFMAGASRQEVSEVFGVKYSTAAEVIGGRRWGHLTTQKAP